MGKHSGERQSAPGFVFIEFGLSDNQLAHVELSAILVAQRLNSRNVKREKDMEATGALIGLILVIEIAAVIGFLLTMLTVGVQ